MRARRGRCRLTTPPPWKSEERVEAGGWGRRPLRYARRSKTGGSSTSLIAIAAVIARQQERWACGATRPHERSCSCSWCTLRSALVGPLHATCHLSTTAAPRSHAALPPRPDLTCIGRASRHATPRPETACCSAPGVTCWPWSAPSPPRTDASPVVDGAPLHEIQASPSIGMAHP